MLQTVDDTTALRVAMGGGSSSEPSNTQQHQLFPPLDPSKHTKPAQSATKSSPREERWVPATLSKAGKVLWKGVKIALAVPTDEELKSYSRTHPPLGHIPMHIPMGTGSIATTPYRPPTARSERAMGQKSGQRAGTPDADGQSVKSMREMLSAPPPAESSAANTTWPMLKKEDYGSHFGKLEV